ncbi:MAG: hypothetical protein QM579_00550 [Desulfovibrio sp.]
MTEKGWQESGVGCGEKHGRVRIGLFYITGLMPDIQYHFCYGGLACTGESQAGAIRNLWSLRQIIVDSPQGQRHALNIVAES